MAASRENPDVNKTQSEGSAPDVEPSSSEQSHADQEPRAEGSPETPHANTEAIFSVENKTIFESMSDRAKAMAGKAYETLHKIPLVNRMVGRMEIAYKQVWADVHDSDARFVKGKIEVLDADTARSNREKAEIVENIKHLGKMNMAGASSLESLLRELDKKQAKIANQRSSLQVKLERSNGKNQTYIDRRDAVADRFIAEYSEKLEPHEKKLEALLAREAEIDLNTSLAEVTHGEKQAELKVAEQRVAGLVAILKSSGWSDGKINAYPAVKYQREAMAKEKETIKKRQEAIAKGKREIRAEIAKTNADATPYRHKRDEFQRIKDRRPAQPQAGTAPRLEVVGDRSVAVDVDGEPVAEVKEQGPEKFELNLAIKNWNKFMNDKYGRNAATRTIDLPTLLKKLNLPPERKLDQASFTKIVKAWGKFTKAPQQQVDADLQTFLAPDEEDLRRAA